MQASSVAHDLPCTTNAYSDERGSSNGGITHACDAVHTHECCREKDDNPIEGKMLGMKGALHKTSYYTFGFPQLLVMTDH